MMMRVKLVNISSAAGRKDSEVNNSKNNRHNKKNKPPPLGVLVKAGSPALCASASEGSNKANSMSSARIVRRCNLFSTTFLDQMLQACRNAGVEGRGGRGLDFAAGQGHQGIDAARCHTDHEPRFADFDHHDPFTRADGGAADDVQYVGCPAAGDAETLGDPGRGGNQEQYGDEADEYL